MPAQPSPAPSPPWPGSGGAAPGIPGAAGMAWRDWRWRAAGASCGQQLVPTGPQCPVRIFSNHMVLAGAPLRNRTVDLLLTMHPGFVRWHLVESDYRRSKEVRCLASSCRVRRCLEALSLGLSLASGSLFRTGVSRQLVRYPSVQCSASAPENPSGFACPGLDGLHRPRLGPRHDAG
jgi:hypothetical protein